MGVPPAAAIIHHRHHGYYASIPVMSADEAAAMRRQLEAREPSHGALNGSMRHKSHLQFAWLTTIRLGKAWRPLEDGGCDFLKS
jgi:hypothetical protein